MTASAASPSVGILSSTQTCHRTPDPLALFALHLPRILHCSSLCCQSWTFSTLPPIPNPSFDLDHPSTLAPPVPPAARPPYYNLIPIIVSLLTLQPQPHKPYPSRVDPSSDHRIALGTQRPTHSLPLATFWHAFILRLRPLLARSRAAHTEVERTLTSLQATSGLV